MKKALTVLFLLIGLISFSQTHTYNVYCSLFKPVKGECCLTYEPDHDRCPACLADDKKKRIEKENKVKAEQKAFAERLNKQLNDEKTFLENQKKDIEQRNIVAENKINNLNSKIEELIKIDAQADLKLKSILDRYKTDQEKINAENDAYLKELRESAKINSPKNTDAFWDETLVPIKYLAFKSKDRDKNGYEVYGYKDEKGNIKIEPKFYNAEEFINGFAKAEIFIKRDGIISKDFQMKEHYQVTFKYIERGVIGKNGLWVKPPQKVLLYNGPYKTGWELHLTKVNSDDTRTQKEIEADENEQYEKMMERREKSKDEIDNKLERYLDKYRSEGYIIESPKN